MKLKFYQGKPEDGASIPRMARNPLLGICIDSRKQNITKCHIQFPTATECDFVCFYITLLLYQDLNLDELVLCSPYLERLTNVTYSYRRQSPGLRMCLFRAKA